MTGVERFVRVMSGKMHDTAIYHSPQLIHLGTMVGDSLKIDMLPDLIPVGNYYVCRTLRQPTSDWTTDVEGVEVKLPKKLWPLQSGDRVLVLEIQNSYHNSDFIIVDVVEGS